jgi:hypothetical protein
MNYMMKPAAAVVLALLPVNAASASTPACPANQVFSASLGQCIAKPATCPANQVYSASLGQCIPKL